MVFETAVHTDVPREEAVDGTGGFTFQSVSSGMDGNHQREIREHLLHQISTRWPIDRDELAHPPSAAYVREDDCYYFSRGKSTGMTYSGRRGNQLTEAILTGEPEDLQPYLPAQIYAATNWEVEKAAGKNCPQWFAPLKIDPSFEADALWEMLHGDSWALETLPVYLTMLEQAAEDLGRKTVIVHPDLDVVMRWFALGTLLMNRETALGLEYRAFAIDVFQGRAQLIGLHPDLQVDSTDGANVIDLVKRRHTPIEVSESARAVAAWAGRLDVYDGLEVISIAQRWMPLLGVQVGVAGAEMVTDACTSIPGRTEWELGLQVIEGLARGGRNEDLSMYFDELTDAIASYRLRGAADFVLAARAARFAAESGIAGLPDAVLLPSLESLAAEPEHAGVWASELDEGGTWRWPETNEPQQLTDLLSDIAVGAPREATGHLLGLVSRLPVPADKLRLRPAFSNAASHLLRQPQLAANGIDSWFGAHEIKSMLRKHLVAGLEDDTKTEQYQALLRSSDWDFLDPALDPQANATMAPFALWLAAARIARLPLEARAQALRAARPVPGRSTWRFVLSGADVAQHLELYTAWVQIAGAETPLRNLILRELKQMAMSDPWQWKPKEAEPWVLFAQALADAAPQDQQVQQRREEVEEFAGLVPTTQERLQENAGRAKDAVDKFFGRFARKKNDLGEPNPASSCQQKDDQEGER